MFYLLFFLSLHVFGSHVEGETTTIFKIFFSKSGENPENTVK